MYEHGLHGQGLGEGSEVTSDGVLLNGHPWTARCLAFLADLGMMDRPNQISNKTVINCNLRCFLKAPIKSLCIYFFFPPYGWPRLAFECRKKCVYIHIQLLAGVWGCPGRDPTTRKEGNGKV